MKLIDADELFKSFESEENPEDSLWTLYGIKRKIEDAPRQEPCEDATLRDIFCMGCEYKEQEPKTGHWIPVSEKLPKKYGVYFVTLNNWNTDFCEFYLYKQAFGMNGNICDEVTAWMPLPEPYKAESEEI